MKELTPESRRAIAALFMLCFGGDDFRRFIVDGYAATVVDDISLSGPLAEQIHSAISVLDHHGRLDDSLFKLLEDARPSRVDEIRVVTSLVLGSPRRPLAAAIGTGPVAPQIIILVTVFAGLLVAGLLVSIIVADRKAVGSDFEPKADFVMVAAKARNSLSSRDFEAAYIAIERARDERTPSRSDRDGDLGATRRREFTHLKLLEALAYRIALGFVDESGRRGELERMIADNLYAAAQNFQRLGDDERSRMLFPRLKCLDSLVRARGELCTNFHEADELTALRKALPAWLDELSEQSNALEDLRIVDPPSAIVDALYALLQQRQGNFDRVRVIQEAVPDHLILARP